MSGSFAHHWPGQKTAYVAPQGIRERMENAAPTKDIDMAQPPPNMDAETHDELRDQSRLSGVRGLPLTERGT